MQRRAQERSHRRSWLQARRHYLLPSRLWACKQSKASITWRHIPVDGARTSQSRRTSQSYPSPFPNRSALSRD